MHVWGDVASGEATLDPGCEFKANMYIGTGRRYTAGFRTNVNRDDP